MVGVDASPTLVREAARHGSGSYVTADAAQLPLTDACADLVVSYMALQDVDDLAGAIREAGRVLVPGGRLCFAVVHPVNSAGAFSERTAEAPFVIAGSYLERRRTDEPRKLRLGPDLVRHEIEKADMQGTDVLAGSGRLAHHQH